MLRLVPLLLLAGPANVRPAADPGDILPAVVGYLAVVGDLLDWDGTTCSGQPPTWLRQPKPLGYGTTYVDKGGVEWQVTSVLERPAPGRFRTVGDAHSVSCDPDDAPRVSERLSSADFDRIGGRGCKVLYVVRPAKNLWSEYGVVGRGRLIELVNRGK